MRRALTRSLVLLALGGLASHGGSTFIAARFADRPMPRDALFELLPYVGAARYLTAAPLVLALVLFLTYAVRRTPGDLPAYISVFALMYIFRAAMMVLTPLASAQGDVPFVFPFEQYGMFPSGHVAAALLFTRLTDSDRAPWLHFTLGTITVVIATAFVVAHGHYSIDVAGGLLLGYFVEKEWYAGTLFDPVKRLVAFE